jgi:catechol 2,3-dioxygenase-like lactoylglutathione lyase family enzyme
VNAKRPTGQVAIRSNAVRLNHVTLPARNVEASAGFYRGVGLTQIVASYPDYARFVSPEGDTTLSLHSAESALAQASIHFAVEDVDGVVADLKKQGFEFECEPIDQPYLWREATLLDPDGNRIFIYHAGEMRLNPPWRLTGEPGQT